MSVISQESDTQAILNPWAIISVVASILGFTTGFSFVAGVIFGHIALHQINTKKYTGKGLAYAGLIIGYLGVAFFILLAAGTAVMFLVAGFYTINQAGPSGMGL